jgi:hypothetical protein
MLNVIFSASAMSGLGAASATNVRRRNLGITRIAAIGISLGIAHGAATAQSFTFKASFRDVKKDPDAIWVGKDFDPPLKGVVTIYEYRLTTPRGEWLISQIWNADCAAATCPTQLVQIATGGERKILVDDMMRQIIPPDDPRFSAIATSGDQAAFAEHPFALADDGKTLLNGDFKFQIGGSKP